MDWFRRCRSWCMFTDGAIRRCQRRRWHPVNVLGFESHLHREPGKPTAIWDDGAERRSRDELLGTLTATLTRIEPEQGSQ